MSLRKTTGQSVLTLNSITELVRDVAHVIQRIGVVVVVLQEVEDAESQHLEGNAHVAVVVEPVQHSDTQMPPFRILLCQLFQHIDLQLRCLPVLVHVFDYLQRNLLVPVVDGESSKTKKSTKISLIDQDTGPANKREKSAAAARNRHQKGE